MLTIYYHAPTIRIRVDGVAPGFLILIHESPVVPNCDGVGDARLAWLWSLEFYG